MSEAASKQSQTEFDERVMRLVGQHTEEAIRHIAYITAVGTFLDISEHLTKIRDALPAFQSEEPADHPFSFVQEPYAPWGIGTTPGSA